MSQKIKAAPAHPLRRRKHVTQVAEYLRDNHANGELLRILFLVGCNTGLRAGDLRKLRVGHFRGFNGHFNVIEEKTGKSRRVYINDAVRRLFDEYMAVKKAEGVIFISDEAHLFLSM